MICKESDNRGLAGVAALIVFVALVLVAAIAAAVILDVGGVLEQQAGETGLEASDQLSSQLNVLSTTGEIEEVDDEAVIGELELTVASSPGANDINLEDTTIEFVTANGAVTMVAAGEGEDSDPSAEPPEFAIDEITSESEFALVTSPEDRHTLEIDLDETGDEALEELSEGESAELTVVTGPGGQTYEAFTVPSTLSTEDSSVSL